jgi:hypothetical protein
MPFAGHEAPGGPRRLTVDAHERAGSAGSCRPGWAQRPAVATPATADLSPGPPPAGRTAAAFPPDRLRHAKGPAHSDCAGPSVAVAGGLPASAPARCGGRRSERVLDPCTGICTLVRSSLAGGTDTAHGAHSVGAARTEAGAITAARLRPTVPSFEWRSVDLMPTAHVAVDGIRTAWPRQGVAARLLQVGSASAAAAVVIRPARHAGATLVPTPAPAGPPRPARPPQVRSCCPGGAASTRGKHDSLPGLRRTVVC